MVSHQALLLLNLAYFREIESQLLVYNLPNGNLNARSRLQAASLVRAVRDRIKIPVNIEQLPGNIC